jgi:hypothetical protein
MSRICPSCGGEASMRCMRCYKVFYCTRACQKSHWPLHKPTCDRVKDTSDNTTQPAPTNYVPEPHPVPDITLEEAYLWESLGRATVLRSNRMGGDWPISISRLQMIKEASIFAEHFFSPTCIPAVTCYRSGITLTGGHRNLKFEPYVNTTEDSVQDVTVLVRFTPNCGEIWLQITFDSGESRQLFTNTFVGSWIASGIMPAPVQSRCTLIQAVGDHPYFRIQDHSNIPLDFGMELREGH